jgi:hypothetical protein
MQEDEMNILINTLLILKNIILFFMAPFIALAYLMALPIVGLYAVTRNLIELATKPVEKTGEVEVVEL